MKTPLEFSKIVPTPTMHAWAQAYNAGNLIAVLALTISPEKESVDEISLPMLGKDLINTLEAEYFTLETKNLNTIKQAITSTIEKLPSDIFLSFCISVIIENIIYLYLYGPGKIIMKRKDKIGILLEQEEEKNLIAGSGYIENNDVLLLETQQFTKIIPLENVSSYLTKEKLHEMTEALSPIVHEKQLGGAAAIAFSYSEKHAPQTIPTAEENISQNLTTPITNDNQISQEENPPSDLPLKRKKLNIKIPKIHFSHSRKLIITITIIVVIVLVASIFFSFRKQKSTIDEKLFQQTVNASQKKYDEGQSLIDLNKNLALEDFQNAKQLLSPARGKFPTQSKENQQTLALSKKIDDAIANLSQTASSDAKQVDSSTSQLLDILLQNSSTKYITQDDKSIYAAGDDSVTSINKSDSKESTLIKNNNFWKNIGGFETYLGNFYILDKSSGILKFVPSGNSYSNSSYFPGSSPDLSKASGMAIDGSIWITSTDGTISKYTRGKQDDFSLKGLDKPLNNPSRIYTSVDINNVYVLDNGNKRIVVLDKNGNYIQQYPAGIISQAQDFQVLEQQKKIYVLSNGKIWEIDLK